MSPRPTVAPERRAAIVRATIRCLARDGYAGLTMKRIAAEAGVSPGILHYYFRDKRAILGRAAATVMADLDRRVATEARGARDARGHLRALLRACLRGGDGEPGLLDGVHRALGRGVPRPELARLNRRAYARARRFLAASVARGTAAGAFRQVAPDEAAAVILALIDGLSLQLTFDPDLMPLGRAVRLAEEALGAYLGGGTAGRPEEPPWLTPRGPSAPACSTTSGPGPPRSTRRGSGRASARRRPSSRRRWRASTRQDARTAVRAGEWTVAQVVDHVAQSTVRAAEELRHLRAGRRPPGPPVYEALLSGAAHRVPWTELVEGLREASAALDAALAGAEHPGPGETGRRHRSRHPRRERAGGRSAAPDIFAAELTWPEYALVQRLHFLDHRAQIRALRAALAASA